MADPTDTKVVDAVLMALNNPKYEWRTIGGIAKEANLDVGAVRVALAEVPDKVVKSAAITESGDELFTSRRRFRESVSPVQRLLGALKNRAD